MNDVHLDSSLTMRFIWARLGDGDNYYCFDDLIDAAEYMNEFGVRRVFRSQKYGVEARGFTSQNYISLFYGDVDAQPTSELSGNDVVFLNHCLRIDEKESNELPTS